MKMGNVTIISVEAGETWRREPEAATVAKELTSVE